MEAPVARYSRKLSKAGLAREEDLLVAVPHGKGRVWHGRSPSADMLEKVLERLNLKAAFLIYPAEPYALIMEHLAAVSPGVIRPEDFETRLLLQDLPIVAERSEAALFHVLTHRRAAFIPGRGVLATDSASLDQAFVLASAVFFACFVKFFSDHLAQKCSGTVDAKSGIAFDKVVPKLDLLPDFAEDLRKGPFTAEPAILAAIAEAGGRTVASHLVDAKFGNISYRLGERLYITRKGSTLDELDGQIQDVPLAGPADLAGNASTEFPAHRRIVLATDYRAVLHGHPRFAVIMSLNCQYRDCPDRGACHIRCSRERFVLDIPVVSGEAGGGSHGLCHTVPPFITRGRGVIVHGHGVFTAGRDDFNEAFRNLVDIEKRCRALYFERVLE